MSVAICSLVASMAKKFRPINMADWGIDIVSMALGGGGTFELDIDHNAFWAQIKPNKQVWFSFSFGQNVYMVPAILQSIYTAVNRVGTFGIVVNIPYNGIILRVTAAFQPTILDDKYTATKLLMVVEQLAIPSV